MSLEILFEDSHIAAVYKPAGVQVHAMKGRRCHGTLISLLDKHWNDAPKPVHRLDRPTSGIVLCGFDKESIADLNRQFRQGEVEKTYRAIVRGWPKDQGDIDIALQVYESHKIQEAFSHYKTLHRWTIPVASQRFPTSRFALVELKPKTGRFHQLRRHMARISHPIIGDTSHGDHRCSKVFRDYYSIQRLMLHAESLRFIHPHTKKAMEILCPARQDFTPWLIHP